MTSDSALLAVIPFLGEPECVCFISFCCSYYCVSKQHIKCAGNFVNAVCRHHTHLTYRVFIARGHFVITVS